MDASHELTLFFCLCPSACRDWSERARREEVSGADGWMDGWLDGTVVSQSLHFPLSTAILSPVYFTCKFLGKFTSQPCIRLGTTRNVGLSTEAAATWDFHYWFHNEPWPWRHSRHSGDLGVTRKPTRLVCWFHSKVRVKSTSQSGRLWYHTKIPLMTTMTSRPSFIPTSWRFDRYFGCTASDINFIRVNDLNTNCAQWIPVKKHTIFDLKSYSQCMT